MDVRVGLWIKLSAKELMLLNHGVQGTLESPLACKEIKPVHPKGNQSWIFIGRTDAEAETPILWSPDMINWLIRKDSETGKDWRGEEKGTTQDEMVGWHHKLKFEFDMSLSKLWELVMDREAWCVAVHRVEKSWTCRVDSSYKKNCVCSECLKDTWRGLLEGWDKLLDKGDFSPSSYPMSIKI